MLGNHNHNHASALFKSRQKASFLSLNEIIDRMAAAICNEVSGQDFAAISKAADAGDVDAVAVRASYRRQARKAHTAFLKALDQPAQ